MPCAMQMFAVIYFKKHILFWESILLGLWRARTSARPPTEPVSPSVPQASLPSSYCLAHKPSVSCLSGDTGQIKPVYNLLSGCVHSWPQILCFTRKTCLWAPFSYLFSPLPYPAWNALLPHVSLQSLSILRFQLQFCPEGLPMPVDHRPLPPASSCFPGWCLSGIISHLLPSSLLLSLLTMPWAGSQTADIPKLKTYRFACVFAIFLKNTRETELPRSYS